MTKVTKKKAIELCEKGTPVYSVRKDGQLSTLFKSNQLQQLIDRDGRKFEFSTGVV